MGYNLVNPRNGAVIASGSARECGEFLGVDEHTVRNAKWAKRQLTLQVEVVECTEDGKPVLSMAEEWDAFMQPLREKYGIAVKRMDSKSNIRTAKPKTTQNNI